MALIECTECGKEISDKASSCPHCGNPLIQLSEEDVLLCPKCYSNSLSANKKGFSAVKAVGGAVLAGGVGLIAGFHGSKNVQITCLSCGHKFKAGEGVTKKPGGENLKGLDKELFDLLKKGQKIQAVNEYIKRKNASISEADDYLRKLAEKNNFQYDTKKSNGGCASVLLLFVLLSIATSVFFF